MTDPDLEKAVVELAQADPTWITWDTEQMEAHPFEVGDKPAVTISSDAGVIGLYWRLETELED